MDILLDSNNEVVFKNNDLVLVEGIQETKQRIIQRLQLFRGEWFLDRSRGIPYFQDILKKGNQVSAISAIFKTEILSVTGVIELLKFEMDYEAKQRELTITVSVRSVERIVSLSIFPTLL
ncbi:MAG: hypothetical protein HRT90_06120 [Candidatus Margulisbacteria bacterium]|nr:hypothetical protein [Candidatus Margulisiibacteriota bacterium]